MKSLLTEILKFFEKIKIKAVEKKIVQNVNLKIYLYCITESKKCYF